MPTVHANGIDIYYEIHGSGEPLMLIAGLGYDIWQWHKILPALAQENQVIIFDNRGVGKSDEPPGPYTSEMMAKDTAELIKALGFKKVNLLGHSMGGFIAQSLVLTYPDLVNKLVLASTNFGGPNHIPMSAETMAKITDLTMDPLERSIWGIKVSTYAGFYEAEPDFVKEWLSYIVSRPVTLTALQAQMAIGLGLTTASVEESFELKLKTVEVPTLILSGDDDRLVPTKNSDLMAEAVPNSQVEIIPKSGHFFPFDRPEEAVIIISRFLRG